MICALLCACGPAGPLDSPWAPAVGGKADAWQPLAEGHHRLDLRSVAHYRDPGTGAEWDLTTRVTALAAPRYGEQPWLALQPCAVTLPELNGYVPWIPEETVTGLPSVEVPLLALEDDPQGFATPATAITLGLDLADPLDDPLPEDADDPAVLDQDADGAPGVTVRVSLFSIHVVMRLTVALQGDAAGGSAEVGMEQVILGDTIPFYDAAASAAEAAAKNELLYTRHTFELQPTDAATCAELD